LAGAEPARHLNRRPDVSACRDADQQPFLTRQTARRRDGVLVLDGDQLVVNVAVEDARHEAGSDALDAAQTWFATREDGRARRLDGDDVHVRQLFFEHLATAGNRAAGAYAGDERVEAALGIAQDLQRRRSAVYGRVGGIIELLRHVVRRVLLHQLLGGE